MRHWVLLVVLGFFVTRNGVQPISGSRLIQWSRSTATYAGGGSGSQGGSGSRYPFSDWFPGGR